MTRETSARAQLTLMTEPKLNHARAQHYNLALYLRPKRLYYLGSFGWGIGPSLDDWFQWQLIIISIAFY